jgi:hypothetical protein
MSRKLKFFFPSLFLFVSVHGQDIGLFDYTSLGIQGYVGTTIGNTFNRIRDSRPFMGEIYFQHQTIPTPNWNYTKTLPQWGLGLSTTHVGSKYVGSIVSFYPFIKLPLLTAGPIESNFRLGFGMGWVQKPYDKIINPENLLISQKINTHANVSWQNEFHLTPHQYINAAISFNHWSNAKISLPNLGVNIPSLSVGYRYAFNTESKKHTQIHDTLDKKIFYKAFLSGGVKQMQVPDSSHYFVSMLTGEISKQLSYSSIVSIGAFITHDHSVKTDTLVKHLRSVNVSQIALYGSYEYNFGRVLVPVQFGLFLYNSNSKLIESVGVRYKLTNNLMAELLLKTHGHKADLMHFGFGYIFR